MSAYEIPLFTPGTFVAAADLSEHQFRFVKVTADDTVDKCSVQGERAVGVQQTDPSAVGESVTVMVHGVTKVVAGELLSAGDPVGTDSSGRAIRLELTSTGADVGSWVLGLCLRGAGAAGRMATILLATPIGYRVTA